MSSPKTPATPTPEAQTPAPKTKSKRTAAEDCAPDSTVKKTKMDTEAPKLDEEAQAEKDAVLKGKVAPPLWGTCNKLFGRRKAAHNAVVAPTDGGYVLLDWHTKQCRATDIVMDWSNDETPDETTLDTLTQKEMEMEKEPSSVAGDMWYLCRIDMDRTARTMALPEKGSDEYNILAKRVIALSGNWRAPLITPFSPGPIDVPVRFFFSDEKMSNRANLWLRHIDVWQEKTAPATLTQYDLDELGASRGEFWTIPTHRIDWDRRLRVRAQSPVY